MKTDINAYRTTDKITTVENDLRNLKKNSHHLRHSKKSKRNSVSRSRSGSQTDSSSSHSREIHELRKSVKNLKSNPMLGDLSIPIHPLSDFISTPKQLLFEAWGAVGLDELLNLAPLSLIDSCRRRERRYSVQDAHLPASWPPFPISEKSKNNSKGLSILWQRCLRELNHLEPSEILSIMSGDRDPFEVTWTPAFVAPSFVDESTQTLQKDASSSPKEIPHRRPADSTTISEPKSREQVENEILELELRARAIRALLTKSNTSVGETTDRRDKA